MESSSDAYGFCKTKAYFWNFSFSDIQSIWLRFGKTLFSKKLQHVFGSPGASIASTITSSNSSTFN